MVAQTNNNADTHENNRNVRCCHFILMIVCNGKLLMYICGIK